MTAPRNPDRLIRAFLAEGQDELPDQVYDAVRDRIEQTNQRVVLGPWRTPFMNRFVAIGLGAAAVVVALYIGAQLVGQPTVVGPPAETPSPTQPPGPDASPRELPLSGQRLTGGTYFLASFPVRITFEVPDGWAGFFESEFEQSVYKPSTDTSLAIAVSFLVVENVVADPCAGQEDAKLLDPPVGPSVDDLVAAISSLEGFEATPPQDITVDGFNGKEFTLTAPDVEGCGATWATAERTAGMGPGEINLLRIVDVDGVRVLISGAYGPETSEADLSVLRQVMDSVQIEP